MIKIKKVEHSAHRELKKIDMAVAKTLLRTAPKKWQYIYSDKKDRKISLIHFKDDLHGNVWEIYAFEDPSLFSDTRRFKNKKKAEEYIFDIFSK